MESERMADIIQEMRMARTEFPFAYEIGRKDEPAEFDADGLMVKPRTIVIEKVTIEALADRIEKAWEREQPKPDPDWKAICEKCKDGEIEPDCEYYGEPNGCNSPIYGEHPKANPGNAAAMRGALGAVYNILEKIQSFIPHLSDVSLMREFSSRVCRAKNVIDAALSAPPRNCDVGTAEEQAERYMKFCKSYPKCTGCPCVGRMQYHQCEFAWEQLPYNEGSAE